MISIRSYFDRSNPIVLQREIALNLMYLFNLRSREALPHLLLSNVAFETDSNGKTYIHINCDTLSKNAKASLSSKEYESIKNVRMYESEMDQSVLWQYSNCTPECLLILKTSKDYFQSL